MSVIGCGIEWASQADALVFVIDDDAVKLMSIEADPPSRRGAWQSRQPRRAVTSVISLEV